MTGVFIFLAPVFFSLILFLILLEILFIEWPPIARHEKWLWLITSVYLILPVFLLIYLNQMGEFKLLSLILITVPAFDIGAYLFGKTLGRHKLAPSISPNKTWEGVLGGFLAVCVALFLSLNHGLCSLDYSEYIQSALSVLLLAIIISTLACLGDLLESWLKRRAGIKDSGNLLPGHGGFLDRIDGFILVTIFVFLFKFQICNLFF
jgi:phosphatidate cytidylyltransferase